MRPGASPSQNGIDGGCPFASATRTMPGSMRRTRHEALPSWKTSPRVRLDRPVLVDRADEGALGLEAHLVVGGVRDRAAREERRRGARACVASRRPFTPSRWSSARRPCVWSATTRSNSSRVEIAVGPGAPERVEERAPRPSPRARRPRRSAARGCRAAAAACGVRSRIASADAAQERGALDELVERQREEPALRDLPQRVARRARRAGGTSRSSAWRRPG